MSRAIRPNLERLCLWRATYNVSFTLHEQKLEDILERRRIEGSFLKLEVMQKVLELVVHESMSKGKGVKGLREKKIWPIEEMKEKPNIFMVED